MTEIQKPNLNHNAISHNPHKDNTIKVMSEVIQGAVGKILLPVSVKAIATALYVKGYRKTIK